MECIFTCSYAPQRLKIPLFILVFLIFSSCSAIKPASTNSGKTYFETFYVGEEGSQYFIKPLLFKTEKVNEQLLVDITFRYKNEIKDSAILNFSIVSPLIYKTVDSLKLLNKNLQIKTNKVKLLFNQKNTSDFISRFTTKFSLEEIKELFEHNEWKFILYNKNQSVEYLSNKKTNKTIFILKNNIFVLMQNN